MMIKTKKLLLVFIFSAKIIYGQDEGIMNFFNIIPSEIAEERLEEQNYSVVLKWQNVDPSSHKRFNCNTVKANYLIDGKGIASWKNVHLAETENFRDKEFNGIKLSAFDSFSYRQLNTDFLKEEFYKNIPLEQIDLARWLVSDAVQMQGLALYVFDSLSFNQPFIPKLLENHDLAFENWVTFTSRYQELIWSGITICNNEICAIVKFNSIYNPLTINNDQMSLKGRSLYYGEMYISLEDKQVEYSFMIEDVLMKMRSSSFTNDQLVNLQREIVFKKTN